MNAIGNFYDSSLFIKEADRIEQKSITGGLFNYDGNSWDLFVQNEVK